MKTKADVYMAMPELKFRDHVLLTHRDYIYGGPTTHAQMKKMVHLWVWVMRNSRNIKNGILIADWWTTIKCYWWLLVNGWVL